MGLLNTWILGLTLTNLLSSVSLGRFERDSVSECLRIEALGKVGLFAMLKGYLAFYLSFLFFFPEKQTLAHSQISAFCSEKRRPWQFTRKQIYFTRLFMRSLDLWVELRLLPEGDLISRM